MADHRRLTLAGFIQAKMQEPTPILPCAPWVCDWVLARTGIDPIADMRTDWSEATVLRRIVSEGGFVEMTTKRLTRAGLAGTDDPRPKDVGIVIGGAGETLAIKTEGGWLGRADSGITMGQFEMVRAWNVPCLS